MRDDRGQALVFSVVLFALVAVTMVGLRDASLRVLERARDLRAGEAAAEAAVTAVADKRGAREMTPSETASFAASPDVVVAAQDAAARMARANGRDAPSDVTVRAFGHEIEVHVTLAGRTHLALLEAAP